jgi:hypothetical protein
MVSPVLRLFAAVLVAAFSLSLASGAMAQQTRDPLMPDSTKLRPWEQRLERFYNEGNPQRETDRATGRLYDDPLHRLGEPENRPLDPSAPAGPAASPPVLQPGVVELDRDNSGGINREEYFRGRMPFMTPQDRLGSRGRRMIDRLDSQFRNADRNRDGIVTPEELQGSENGRF